MILLRRDLATVVGVRVTAPVPAGTSTVEARLAQEEETASALYGLIVSMAVMASVHADSGLQVAVATLVTLLVYWTAERFAHVMARRIVLTSSGFRREDLKHELGHGWEMVTASFLPLGALLVSRLLGATVTAAVLVALVSATVLLAAGGWRVGSGAGLGVPGRIGSAVCAAALGGVMVMLKALLH